MAKVAAVLGWNAKTKTAFLEAFAVTCNVTRSCAAVGLHTAGAYKVRARDPVFRAAWDAALLEGYARLEGSVLHRALEGMEDGDSDAGGSAGDVKARGPSDAYLLGLLRLHATRVGELRGAATATPVDDAAWRARLTAQLDALWHASMPKHAPVVAAACSARRAPPPTMTTRPAQRGHDRAPHRDRCKPGASGGACRAESRPHRRAG